ncbi:hypothetical protein ACFVAV_08060 [Nocardia sp. NPDC057663]|uniref:hypothetical protein n=1 Tax=Nocardia sp. NPDC057663 TaxID=3346201 RepID=UPI0036715314
MDDCFSVGRVCGVGSKIVLGIDFEGSRRGARLEDLAAEFHDETTLYRCHTIGYSGLRPRDALAHATDCWLSGLGAGRSDVAVVVGFCSGGHIASYLANRLAADFGMDVPVVTFDTLPLDEKTIISEYNRYISNLHEFLEPADIAMAHRIPVGADLEPRSLADSLVNGYANLVERAADRAGIGGRVASQIVGSFAAYLEYLVLAICAEGGSHDVSDRIRIFSEEYNRFFGAEGITAKVGHDDLLLSDESRNTLRAVLMSD